jgi:hypothetical protein
LNFKLLVIRTIVLRGDAVAGSHVREYVAENFFTLDDLVRSILTGSIVAVEDDEYCQSCDGKKYTIRGQMLCGDPLETVGKIMGSDDRRFYFVITAYPKE